MTSSAGASYLWSTGETTQAINVTTAGSYTVQVGNGSGCLSVVSTATNVTVTPLPTDVPSLTASIATNLCSTNSTINLTALVSGTLPSGVTLEWFTNNSNPPTGTAYATPATTSVSGTYYAFYKSTSGCYGAASAIGVVVTVNICPIDSGGIALIKKGVLNDANNDGFQQAGETITYSFTVTNTGNVTLTDVSIEDLLPGIVMSGSPFSLAVGATNSVAYMGVYTIKQTDIIKGSVSNQATVSGQTPAGIKVTDKSDDSSIVEDDTTVVTTDGCVIEVFNGLTPGNDGKNDVFYIRGIECFPNNSIQVFNRWGIVVFDKTGYNNTDRAFRGMSDGNLTVAKSEELPVGTYYYVFKYTDNASMSYEKAGYLYINK